MQSDRQKGHTDRHDVGQTEANKQTGTYAGSQTGRQVDNRQTVTQLYTPYQLKINPQEQLMLTMSLVLVHMTAYKCR